MVHLKSQSVQVKAMLNLQSVRFAEYAKDVYSDFTGKPVKEFCVGKGMEALSDRTTYIELLDTLESILADYCSEEA